MELPNQFEQVEWYGRGPFENYWDRKTSAFVGRYKSTVSDLYYPYASPQENGNRADVRWVAFSDGNGTGVIVAGKPHINFTALHYTPDDLTQEERGTMHTIDLVKKDFISLSVDYQQMGLGGDDSWGAPTHREYTLPVKGYSYEFRLIPYSGEKDPGEIANVLIRED